MRPDRSPGDEQLLGDLRIRLPDGQQPQHGHLSFRQSSLWNRQIRQHAQRRFWSIGQQRIDRSEKPLQGVGFTGLPGGGKGRVSQASTGAFCRLLVGITSRQREL